MEVLLEDENGNLQHHSCARVAVIWQGKQVWLQDVGVPQLMIGVDVEEGDTEYANLLMRPMATNLVSLELEMESAEDYVDDEEHVHGPDCNHN